MDRKLYSRAVENLLEAAVINITRCNKLIVISRQLVENSKKLNERCRESISVIQASNSGPSYKLRY
jgi:hypothetical protein